MKAKKQRGRRRRKAALAQILYWLRVLVRTLILPSP